MATKQKEYLVTDGSFYTMHPTLPLVTEHRLQLVEEIPTPSFGDKLWNVLKRAFQVVGVIFIVLFIIGLISGMAGP